MIVLVPYLAITLLIMPLAAIIGSSPPAANARAATIRDAGIDSAMPSKLETVWLYNPAGTRGDGIPVDWQLKKTMEEAGINKPPLAAQSLLRVEMILTDDPYPAANKLFYNRGWTDGLPIVPPTGDKVAEMLKGTDLPSNRLVATLDPMGGQATVQKIAINAVMAGCRPEYMPVLIAAVEAIADPVFNLAGVGTTTNPDATMLIVNGPIAKQLDINSGSNALGRGWEANATIGRALHLIEQNIGGSLTPFTAQKLAAEGWNKDSIRQYIADHARVPLFPHKGKFMGSGTGQEVPAAVMATIDANGAVQVPFVSDLTILVAGGVGEKDGLIPLWSPPVSREIKLPPNWSDLLSVTTQQ